MVTPGRSARHGPRDRRRTPARAALALALLASVVACSATTRPAGPAAPAGAADAAARLTGELTQHRRDVEAGVVQVKLRLPDGAAPLTLLGVALDAGAFPDAVPLERQVELVPGRAVDLPVAHGAPDCAALDAAGAPAAGSARVRLADRSGPVVVPLADPRGRLASAAGRVCRAEEVAAVLPVAWDATWLPGGPGGPAAQVVLHLGPVAAGHRVRVEALRPTTLFALAPLDPAALTVELGPGESSEVLVGWDPARCDPHAVAEDKRGFAPEVVVSVDGAEAVPVLRWVPEGERSVATAALLDRCGLG